MKLHLTQNYLHLIKIIWNTNVAANAFSQPRTCFATKEFHTPTYSQ